MSTDEDSMQCLQCGAESFVALRNERTKCAECLMDLVSDPVVIDALSRAICAVIADAVKDDRKAKEAEADSFRVKFNSEGVECNALNRAHGWTGTNCVCVDCVAHRVEARRQTEERAAAHLRHQEMLSPGSTTGRNAFISKNKPAMTAEQAMQVAAARRSRECPSQPHGHSPEDRFYRSDVPQFTPEEVRAAMQPSVPDPVVSDTPPVRPMSTRAEDYCLRCHSDMSYADPGQTLCYGCRST
jgi:hypothetical protein